MGKILVTGASGNIGNATIQKLMDRGIPPNQLVALVRDPAKAMDLQKAGVEVHQGDYMDPSSLKRALKGVEKLMLVSTQAFTDRKKAHANVIEAAVKSEIKHIVAMPIIRKEGSGFSIKNVTEEDIFTEDKIRSSGIPYTFVKHPPFIDTLPPYFGSRVFQTGILVPSGSGKLAAAAREDLAEAHAAVLTQPGHEFKTYLLTGSSAASFADLADILSKLSGKKVPLISISDEEYVHNRIADGLPDFVASFLLEWVKGFNRGEWDNVTSDLEKLIGHKPTTIADFFQRLYQNGRGL